MIRLKVMLYFANMGGVGFWVAFWTLLLGVELLNVYVESLDLHGQLYRL